MRHIQLAILVAWVAGVGVAGAQDRPPDWLRRPTARDISALWPRKALDLGAGGKATIGCVVTVQGTLRACEVVAETPEGLGFGGAALALSTQFLMKPALKDGVAVESFVQFPIQFPRPEPATGSYLSPATASSFVNRQRVLTHVPWRQAPTVAEVLEAYPAKARLAKVGGAAVLDCSIKKDGGLSACRVMRETPEGLGFGNAARSLAPRFSAPTDNSEGDSVAGSHVHLSVTFAANGLDAPTPAIGRPEWTALPAVEDFAGVIPPAARRAGIYKARVVMTCAVVTGGGLDGCVSQSEDPPGLGYADAALKLARAFRMEVWTAEGLPVVGGTIRLPLRFDLEAAMAAKPAP